MKEQELKKCPFCGKTPKLLNFGDFWEIHCKNEDCFMKPKTNLADRESVIRQWQRRYNDESM